jgi:hypothetical protein
MALSEAQTFGFSDAVRELFAKARKDLEKGGLDVDEILAGLERAHAKASASNAVQEEAKRKSKEATEVFYVDKRALYWAASGALDMAIGAVGKGTIAAANFRKLRSDIVRDAAPEDTVETPGTPPPDATA